MDFYYYFDCNRNAQSIFNKMFSLVVQIAQGKYQKNIYLSFIGDENSEIIWREAINALL